MQFLSYLNWIIIYVNLLQIRVGFPVPAGNENYGMEELIYKYGVDVHLQAHEHSYERMWPVYNNTVRIRRD